MDQLPFQPSEALFLVLAISISSLIRWIMNRKKPEVLPPKRDPPRIDPKFNFVTRSFLKDRAAPGLKMVVFYGSQSGTAEEFARLLALEGQTYNIRAIVADPEECEIEELMSLQRDETNKIVENYLFVFCLASYGAGDPTDNAKDFYEWVMKKKNLDLSGLKYAVFGCGNKIYEYYNKVALDVDHRIEEIGGDRVFQVGLGNADQNIDDDFTEWKEKFWQKVCQKYELEGSGDGDLPRKYNLQLHHDMTPEAVSSPHQENLQNSRHNSKNPFLAQVKVNKELHKGGDRSCMHIEFDIRGSNMRYETGDHVGIFAENDAELVTSLGSLCKASSENDQKADLDTVFSLTNFETDEENEKHPFPCPTTYRIALTHHIEITARPRTHVLKELIRYCSDEKDKEFLRLLSSTTPEGKAKYQSWVQDACRNIVHILEDIPSCRPPIDHICELLPRLQPRYYSISSSRKVHPTTVHITAVLVDYKTPTGRRSKGVATSYLAQKQPIEGKPLPRVPIFIRRSEFRLPSQPEGRPVIMVGPGTGLAPFRGFIQERNLEFEQNQLIGKKSEKTLLFFGCRRRSEDFLYQEELEGYEKHGSLNLHVAFSREPGEKKVYVTHLLEQNADTVWDLIKSENRGYFYICGDAKNMATDVRRILLKIIGTKGKMTEEKALEYFKTLQRQGRYSTDVWS